MKRCALERFTSKYAMDESTGCWLWTANTTSQGYGMFRVGERMLYAHRYSYEALVGPIAKGLQLDHLCRIRNCVNPDHLEPVTPGENSRRAAAIRTTCPEGHPYSGDNLLMEGTRRRCRTCRLKQNKSRHEARMEYQRRYRAQRRTAK